MPSSGMLFYCLLALSSAGAAAPLQPQPEAAVAGAPLSGVYRTGNGALAIEGVVARKKIVGETTQQTERKYKLVQSPRVVRAEVCSTEGKKLCAVYLVRDHRLVVFLQGSDTLADFAVADPDARNAIEAISTIRMSLHGRLVEFLAKPHESKFLKEEQVDFQGRRVRTRRVRLESARREKQRWVADLWIEPEQGLILQSRISLQEDAGLLEEVFRLIAIKAGDEIPSSELDWSPPASATRMKRYPSGPLPQ